MSAMKRHSRLYYVSFFVIGSIFGIAGVSVYQEGFFTNSNRFIHNEMANVLAGDSQASACILNEEVDDIFFVSCGAIY